MIYIRNATQATLHKMKIKITFNKISLYSIHILDYYPHRHRLIASSPYNQVLFPSLVNLVLSMTSVSSTI